MTLQELLVERGLTTALILDDAYDDVPRAEDLVGDEEVWANFLDDVRPYHDEIVSAFPAFDALDGQSLRQSDEFVAALWQLRGKLPSELWDPLFEAYEQGTRSDRDFLQKLETELTNLGVQLTTAGRDPPAKAKEAAIIFADLFLGAAQQDPDMERSLGRLRDLLADRPGNPPLVILMSRSDLLNDKKAYFRDSADLLGAMFRVYSKRDLLSGSTLVRTLERLATNRPDALRVAEFIHAWNTGLDAANKRFMRVIRRLDLSDYVQIRNVLLDFEGQPLGSYMLDVFDRVLQHEVEGEAATIAAAGALNTIKPQEYPAPYIAGSSDLQELVYRTIWQHPRRLAVKNTEDGFPVSFGDVIVHRALLTADPTRLEGDVDTLVVLTASCDLVRGGARRVMLMGGALADLTSKTWTYKGAMKTPIILLPGDRRMWVKWDVKDVRTFLPAEIGALLAETGRYEITQRLREAYALELQQHLLADMGRVGVLAPMPGTFPVSVSIATHDVDGNIRRLSTPVADKEGGICYTGRDEEGKENTRLVLTEECADELLGEIAKLDTGNTFEKAHYMLRNLKASTFGDLLQRGLELPSAQSTKWAPVKAQVEEKGVLSSVEVASIARNPPPEPAPSKQAALIITLQDTEPKAAAANVLVEAAREKTISTDGGTSSE